ncbi:bifunctional 2-polyprenyl-6-hydroxyphenol methylase/3-demethylubiquinol 3-O-methyltransferase UbiG [Oceanobacillus sojae]|uniref:class I SAM-dependent methyltransferase n=1 Tax=Oceanobacillus sojae TaxID=582851 RepID=UPI0021A336FB|nr:class I SAM-dependent methyltransferase [Oceanobacillus sojae]MCT1902991.1 class I SAM-dependent methyltransferase [Oceanobacillus sojae]
MNEQSKRNKIAWEHRAYEFWNKRYGAPEKLAEEIIKNPITHLKKHKQYFRHIEGKKVANLCGSNGRKAVPIALLGADVTVFDISEENKQYALELAGYAKTTMDYIVTDIYEIDLSAYQNYFDVLYLEGGILHYFDDIERLIGILYALLKPNGKMILSDFHPLRKCILTDSEKGSYFGNKNLQLGDLAYKDFFDEAEQTDFPSVSIRLYTLSDIINAVIGSGFQLEKFDEHRSWNGEDIPWEFTILARK